MTCREMLVLPNRKHNSHNKYSSLPKKQELKKIMEIHHSQESKNLYTQLQEDLKDILLMEKSKMLGRDYTLGKNTNPLLEQSQSTVQGMGGSLGLSTA